MLGGQPASGSARCKRALAELLQIDKQKLQSNPVGVSEVDHAANASDIANARVWNIAGVEPTYPVPQFIWRFGRERKVIQPCAARLEFLSLVRCMLNQVETEGSKTDNRHPTRKRWTVAVVGFANQSCSQHIAVEANTAVEIPDRQAHVMRACDLRMAKFAVHDAHDASAGDPEPTSSTYSLTSVQATARATKMAEKSRAGYANGGTAHTPGTGCGRHTSALFSGRSTPRR
jgi:hypothetical protein